MVGGYVSDSESVAFGFDPETWEGDVGSLQFAQFADDEAISSSVQQKKEESEEEDDDIGVFSPTMEERSEHMKKQQQQQQVLLEGYVETKGSSDENPGVPRTKSLTDEDLDELKGCLDLGFGFSYEEIPELCNTLPALELCYSMSQKFSDDQQKAPPTPEIANWKISSPGDHPDDVKARLKFWAQAVACTVRLCS